MKKRIIIKAVNGMRINFKLRDVEGIGTKLNDGTYLSVRMKDEREFPIHRDDQRKAILALYGGEVSDD